MPTIQKLEISGLNLGQIVSRTNDYSDLDLDFGVNPGTGDVDILYGAEAIKRSVRNLIMTNFYDRPFRPYIGSNTLKLLFENITPFTLSVLQDTITQVLANYEPRISVQSVNVIYDEAEDLNGITVTINYTILNRLQPILQSIWLERLR